MKHKIARLTGTAAVLVFSGFLIGDGISQEEDKGAGGAGSVILKEDGHWRVWAVRGVDRLNPAVLKDKAECDKWQFTDRWMRGVEQRTKWLWEAEKIDWTKTDWRDKACTYFYDIGCPFQGMKALFQHTPPPADWMKPAFDDSSWMVEWNTLSERAGHPYPYASTFNWNLFYRGYFLVPDTAKARDLAFSVTFRGGCRVFVNGKEVGRANLPAGEITPDTTGDPYPEEAYRAFLDETAEGKTRPSISDIRTRFIKGERNSDPRYVEFRLPPGFADHSDWINRKGWDRIMKLRDRKLEAVTIPANLLVKGKNILAVEIRGGYHHPIICKDGWAFSMSCNTSWASCELLKLELKDPAGILPPAMAVGQGLQAWVEDMHSRIYNTEYRPALLQGGTVRLVGAQNGNYSGMAVVWCDTDLTDLKAEISDLSSVSGNSSFSIPRSAFSVTGMVGEPVTKIAPLGYFGGGDRGNFHVMALEAFNHAIQSPYASIKPNRQDHGWWSQEGPKVLFYDHIGSDLPAKVPAKTAQPLWISLKIPAEAAPGLYKGALRIEAAGQPPVSLPVEAEVIGWRVPDPQEFQTDVALEQHPYAIAGAYLLSAKLKERTANAKGGATVSRKPEETPGSREWPGPVESGLPLWSDEHFKYLEASFKQLGRVGNDLLYVPVLERTEFGNWQDSMIKWIRRKDGSIAFDYTALDRYLDLAVKYLGKPRVICFVVMHCCISSPPPTVPIYNEATGKNEETGVGYRENPFTRLPLWQAFASQLFQHMKEKGLDKSVYWGHAGDHESDAGLMMFIQQVFPGHYWCASGHTYHGGAGGGGHSRNTVRYFADIYGAPQPVESLTGWKSSYNTTRSWSAFNIQYTYDVNYDRFKYESALLADETYLYVHCPRDELHGIHFPIRWRTIPALSLHRSYSGVGRLGFDGWNCDWLSGYNAGLDWGFPGRPCNMLSWPGKNGADSGARFEALLEGIQETEARTFLEQAIDRGLVSVEAAAEAKRAIQNHLGQACLWPQLRSDLVYDYLHPWQEYSRELYGMAARVAALVGVDIARTDLLTTVPALGRTPRSILLRNWSKEPRAWKAEASAPWLKLSKMEGTLKGFQELPFDVDGAGLKPRTKETGAITVTDAVTGKKSVLKIGVSVNDPVELLYDHPHFNVQVGRTEVRDFRVLNNAATEQDWKLTVPVSWIKAEPSSGKLGPGKDVFVKLTASPPDQEARTHENPFKFDAANGMVSTRFTSKTFVIPLYKEKEERFMPPGRIVKIEDFDPKRFTYHVNCAKGTVIEAGSVKDMGRKATQAFKNPSFTPIGPNANGNPSGMVLLIGKERFSRGMWVYPHHESVWNLEGSKVTAFMAYVGVTEDAMLYIIRNHVRRVNFEIWVDGKPRVQTGLMKVNDPARYLTVEGLDEAKELKLVTRLDSDEDDNTFLATWCDACFLEKYEKKDAETGKVIKKEDGTGKEKGDGK